MDILLPNKYLARPNKMPVNGTSIINGKTELLFDDDKTELLSDMDAAEILDEGDEFEISSSIIDPRSDVYSIGAVMLPPSLNFVERQSCIMKRIMIIHRRCLKIMLRYRK